VVDVAGDEVGVEDEEEPVVVVGSAVVGGVVVDVGCRAAIGAASGSSERSTMSPNASHAAP
jgi:hypothetical protein